MRAFPLRALLVLALSVGLSVGRSNAVPDQPLADRLAALREQAPAGPRLHFGYKVIDADSGETLAANRSAELFTPASNNKLFTTAFALLKLGPDYRFTTELRTGGGILADAASLPGLEIIGGGDPNLSGRVLPYAPNIPDGDPVGPLRDLANRLKQRGVRSINGDVTGVATRYGDPRYPDGWATDDLAFDYGAAVSSLVVNDNTITLSLHSTEGGELADIQLRPAVAHFVVLNEVQTAAEGTTELHVSRPLGSNEVVIWGTIAENAGELKVDLAVDDPALFAAECLRDALEDEGIAIRGEPRAEYRNPTDGTAPPVGGTILATHESAPLSEIVQVTNKVSQNLHAELLLREAALATGPAADPLVERQKFLDSIGITRDGSGYEASDGSGLARQDKVTPDAIVSLLRFMWQSRLKETWLESLPVGAVDGTLHSRFKGIANADRVHAKTGSLGHVDTLSGYLQTKSGRWLAFSLMADDTLASDRDVRTFLDSFCAAMIEE